METLQNPTETIARKDHQCSFCSFRIDKGSTYLKSSHKYDRELYTWKSHKYCSELTDKLNMADYCDEGISQDFFIESVQEEFMSIMQKTQPEIYEAKGYNYPKLKEQLQFVLNHHQLL